MSVLFAEGAVRRSQQAGCRTPACAPLQPGAPSSVLSGPHPSGAQARGTTTVPTFRQNLRFADVTSARE